MDRTRSNRPLTNPILSSLPSDSVSSISEDAPPSPESHPSPYLLSLINRKYPCHLCPAAFFEYTWLYRHTRKVHNVNPLGGVQCDLCSLYYENEHGLRVHQDRMHKNRYRRRDQENIRKRVKTEKEEGTAGENKSKFSYAHNPTALQPPGLPCIEVKDEKVEIAVEGTTAQDVKKLEHLSLSNPATPPQYIEIKDEEVFARSETAVQSGSKPEHSYLPTAPLCIEVKDEEVYVTCPLCLKEVEQEEAMEHMNEHKEERLQGFGEVITKIVTANVLMTIQVLGFVARR